MYLDVALTSTTDNGHGCCYVQENKENNQCKTNLSNNNYGLDVFVIQYLRNATSDFNDRVNAESMEHCFLIDESLFCLRRGNGESGFIIDVHGERYSGVYVRIVNRFGGDSVVVWSGTSFYHRIQMVILAGTLTAL